MTVLVVDSGVANLASVQRAFATLSVPASVSRDPERIAAAERLVLPGVGSFGTAARELETAGATRALREAVGRGVPLAAICLGLQLLCEGSEESPEVPGLGIVPGRVRRLPDGVRVPHLGWNRLRVDAGSRLLAEGDAAFANSYALFEAPPGCAAAWTTHGRTFVAAFERGPLLACQFHPELSGRFGLALLDRWLRDEPAARDDRPEARPEGLARRLVPCLDVKDGRVVKGVRFQGLRDAGDPAELARAYQDQGADEIVILDVAATPQGRAHRRRTVERVRAVLGIPLTVGGGVRELDDARALLSAGADKVSVNTAAVRRPELLSEMAGALGRQCTVLAVDARRADGGGWEVLLNGGREPTGRDAIAWMREATERDAGEVLLTSWDRDGTREGCDLDLLRVASQAVSVPVIASGGIGTPEHVVDAVEAGADAVLCASVLHDGDHVVADLKAALVRRGFGVRS